jgi:hypothetical protein
MDLAMRPTAPGDFGRVRLAVPGNASLIGVGVALLGVVGMLFWYLSISTIRLSEMTDLGLVSVVPAWAYLGFVPIAAGFAAALAWPPAPRWLAPALVVVVILTLYGAAPWIEGTARFSPSWRHLGIIDYVTRHGTVNPAIDAYHNWPGMFIIASAAQQVLGITDLVPLALWAPVFFSLAYLPGLYLVFEALVPDRRVIWLGILIFYLGDWIGQDYFSPQAIGFFFYLVMVAVVVRWLIHPDAHRPALLPAGRRFHPRTLLARLISRMGARDPMPADSLPPLTRTILIAAVIAMFLFVVASHQLTPFFTIAAVGGLAVLRRMPWYGLSVVMGVIVAAWVAFAAVAFLVGHFQNVAGYVGTLSESLAANLTGRIQGSDGHRLMVLLRLGLTGTLWALAGLGGLRRMRNGRWDVTAGALALVPLPLFAVQAYGGEMLLRIALFSLPFTALLVALLVLPRPSVTTGPLARVIVFVVALSMMVGFVVTRYGNERIESFSRGEIAGVARLYEIAPPGSLLIGIVGNLPWKSIGYESYRYRPNGDETYFDQLDAMMTVIVDHDGPAYLILTRGQEAYVQMILDKPASAWDAFVQTIFATGRFTVVYQNPDAIIARYVPPVRTP